MSTERIVELRSDTFTKPTPQMREAMFHADVGNDCRGEDPTTNSLEEKSAALLGKESAMFVASGTMGNLCAVMAHCKPGDGVVLDRLSHLFTSEAGSFSTLAGCLAFPIDAPHGVFNLEELAASIDNDRASQVNTATGLVCLENTHNFRGGIAVSGDSTMKIADVAHEKGVPVHLDGARIFNAAVSLGTEARDLCRDVDSVQFCLSKGLGCPIGSVLVGKEDFIRRARRARRSLGGGMRQVGVIAAAGLVALDTMIERLADDHRRAGQLAAGLSEIRGLTVSPSSNYTNMVFVSLEDKTRTSIIVHELASLGINVFLSLGNNQLRLVTHYEIDDEAIDQTISAFRKLLQQ
jgi:threonine aldolase